MGGREVWRTASDWRAASMQASKGIFKREATAEKDSSISSCPLCSTAPRMNPDFKPILEDTIEA